VPAAVSAFSHHRRYQRQGGVGRNIALNLAIALARQQASVGILDANLGLGNIDLLCGLNGYWNLSHVVTGARCLNEIVLTGPEGIHVVPGASGLADVADCPDSAQQEIFIQLEDFEQSHDFVIIDTGPGIHRSVREFVTSAALVLIVTTPEPTALADAYATVKALSTTDDGPRIELLVNQAASAAQADAVIQRLQQTARLFLNSNVGSAGAMSLRRLWSRPSNAGNPFAGESSLPAAIASRNWPNV
jgi:flagellar biosynthesis protein FlhG